MSIEAFIAALRAEIANHRKGQLGLITGGTLNEKQYGYACGYLRALDDVVKAREPTQPGQSPPALGFIEQVISDMRKE